MVLIYNSKVQSKFPQLRILVSGRCGKKCIFCREGGEFYPSEVTLSLKELKRIINCLILGGAREIKITGGEPIFNKNLFNIISFIKDRTEKTHLTLLTRENISISLATEIKRHKVDCLNFSVDTINPKKMSMINGIPSNHAENYLNSIKSISNGLDLKLKINSVIMNNINNNEIWDIINFASSLNAELKLLDLINLEHNHDFWKAHYYPFDSLEKQLLNLSSSNAIELRPGGIGHPMSKFTLSHNGIVVIKDARKGGWYNDDCQKCKHFPCQDAIMALRLTPDGKLVKCLLNNEDYYDISLDIKRGLDDILITKRVIEFVNRVYLTAKFYPSLWRESVGL